MEEGKRKNPLNLTSAQFSANWKQLQKQLKQEIEEKKVESKLKSGNKKKSKRRRDRKHKNKDNSQSTSSNEPKLTKTLSLDCEYVGTGVDGKDNMLARVSIVNQQGLCVYDKYVKATDAITDFRTEVSGIRPGQLKKGESFSTIQKEVSDILDGRILVGHAIRNDLKVLHLSHPRRFIRDTAKFKLFRERIKQIKGTPSLKKLANHLLGVQIQQNEHDSIQDAKIAMNLYQMYKKQWEKSIRNR